MLPRWTKRAALAGFIVGAVILANVYPGGWGPGADAAPIPTSDAAYSFAVLGSTGVTAAGAAGTVVSGNVGSSPTATISGFGPAVVAPGFGWSVHTTDDLAASTAQAAVGALYTSLSSGACDTNQIAPSVPLAGNFGPGIHCFSAIADLAASGNLTLTGAGTYIFRVGSGLTANALSTVTLGAGVNACDVYWQVGSAATLNGVNFPGNVVALTGVTLGVNAGLTGRALVNATGGGGPVILSGNNTVGGCSAPVVPPTLGKGFNPVSITAGGVSTLTITLSNPNTAAATLTAALPDTLPAGVVIATPPNASTTCGAGVVTALANATTVTLATGAVIPASGGGGPGTCTVTVSVTAALAGVYSNTLAAGALQTSNGNNAAAVTATLTAVAPPTTPTLAKGFIPVSITAGAVSTLTIVLSNPNLVAATLTAALTDSLPAGVVIAAPPNASTTCGVGVVTALAGASTVTLTGGAIPAGIIGTPGACTVTVDVTGSLAGAYLNTLPAGVLQTSSGNNAAAVAATLTVVPVVGPPTAAKGFIPVSITAGGVSTLTIVLSNPNLVAATLTAALTDTLPAGVVIYATPNASTTCGVGVVTALAGGAAVTLTGGAIPAGIIGTPGTCTVIVAVTSPVGGSYINMLSAGALQTSNGNNAAAALATLTAVSPPSGGGGGGGGGGNAPTPTPTVTSGYSLMSAAFCLVEECPFGAEVLQPGQLMYATFRLNKPPTGLVRTEVYWNGAKYTSFSWPEPYAGVGVFTSSTMLGAAPDVGVVELRVWVGSAYIGAFSATVVNPFVRGTCPGNAANCPQIVGPASGIRLSTLGTKLLWWNPPGTTQVQLRVTPANNDGPAINLIFGSAITSYTVAEPNFGTGPYVILPGITYTWQARVTSQTSPATETDGSWGAWSDPHMFQTRTTSSDGILLLFPPNRGSVNTLTPTLQWSNSDVSCFYYEVQLSPDPNFGANGAIAPVYWELRHGGMTNPPNSYSVAPAFALSPATTYYWRVRPRMQGDGVPVSWSQASSFRTP